MKSLIVQKYGGMCLATPEKVQEVADEIVRVKNQGHDLVVVVSAMGKTTDQLISLAYQVSKTPARRELDMLLTTGERISMALLSMALLDRNCPSVSFTGSQAGILTDASHSQAKITAVKPFRIEHELKQGKVIILAGFQGVNPDTKEITTLGRGGSDTSAVAIAARLNADRCEILKELDAVCSADPRIVKNAKTLKKITFSHLQEMCFWGAKVLHYRSTELAAQFQVPIVIKKIQTEVETMIVKDETLLEQNRVLAINSHQRIERIECPDKDIAKSLKTLGVALAKSNLPWPQILNAGHSNGNAVLYMTSDTEALDQMSKVCPWPHKSYSTVTLTCQGLIQSDLLSSILDSVANLKLELVDVFVTPMSISLVLPQDQRESAIRALHEKWI